MDIQAHSDIILHRLHTVLRNIKSLRLISQLIWDIHPYRQLAVHSRQ